MSTESPSANALPGILRAAERDLAEFYNFPLQVSAGDHLMTRDDLSTSLGDYAKSRPEWSARGGVWTLHSPDTDELFLGIHFDEDIKDALENQDPTKCLDDGNLDAFCVIAEELSHFHLIVNRAEDERQVTKLELEWQGEVDKLLLSALNLHRQQGDPHVVPLARRLYDLASITADDYDRYWNATKYAARFWYEASRYGEREAMDAMQDYLQWSYRADWAGKKSSLDPPAFERAS